VERAWPHPGVRPRAHRARQRPRLGDAAAAAFDALPPPRELLDATADGIRLLRIGDEVGITVLGIHAEDRQAGAVEAQQRLPRRAAPPVVKLEESSDDELYRPTPPCFGDAGQGSSRQAPPPQDDDNSSDDGGDYTRFYRHFGM
jgi:hypothetical protein